MLRAAERRILHARNARTLIANFSRIRRPVGGRTITGLTSRITTLCRIRRTHERRACARKRVACVDAGAVARRTSCMLRAAERRILHARNARTLIANFSRIRRPAGGRTITGLTSRVTTLCRIRRTRGRGAGTCKRVAYVDAGAVTRVAIVRRRAERVHTWNGKALGRDSRARSVQSTQIVVV
jgi:hypothetical protein